MIESFERSLQQREDIPQRTRVVVMLGARMRDPKGKEEWQFPLFSPDQTNVGTSLPGEVSGGWSRMRATQSEYRKSSESTPHEDLRVLVTGGKEKSGGSRADEAAGELVKRYGLDPSSVVSMGGIGSTSGNAAATAEYIQSHVEKLGNIRSIELVTNDYHMLRAWTMFSQGMLKSTADRDLVVSPDDTATTKKLLDEGLPDTKDWTPAHVRETREKIMAILQPYFAGSKIHVTPVVAEETLENDAEVHPAKGRYARLLRNNRWVRETLRFEYQGIKDLLDGKYRGK